MQALLDDKEQEFDIERAQSAERLSEAHSTIDRQEVCCHCASAGSAYSGRKSHLASVVRAVQCCTSLLVAMFCSNSPCDNLTNAYRPA
jgi:hypothetical protein